MRYKTNQCGQVSEIDTGRGFQALGQFALKPGRPPGPPPTIPPTTGPIYPPTGPVRPPRPTTFAAKPGPRRPTPTFPPTTRPTVPTGPVRPPPPLSPADKFEADVAHHMKCFRKCASGWFSGWGCRIGCRRACAGGIFPDARPCFEAEDRVRRERRG